MEKLTVTGRTVLEYYTKHVYGNELAYFAHYRDAANWFNLTGKRTISEREMQTLTAMTGAQFTRVFEPAEV